MISMIPALSSPVVLLFIIFFRHEIRTGFARLRVGLGRKVEVVQGSDFSCIEDTGYWPLKVAERRVRMSRSPTRGSPEPGPRGAPVLFARSTKASEVTLTYRHLLTQIQVSTRSISPTIFAETVTGMSNKTSVRCFSLIHVSRLGTDEDYSRSDSNWIFYFCFLL